MVCEAMVNMRTIKGLMAQTKKCLGDDDISLEVAETQSTRTTSISQLMVDTKGKTGKMRRFVGEMGAKD